MPRYGYRYRYIVNNWTQDNFWNLHVECDSEEEAVSLFMARWPEAPDPGGALLLDEENQNLWQGHGHGTKYNLVSDLYGTYLEGPVEE